MTTAEQAFQSYRESLMRTAMLLVGSVEEAEDLVQEVFARALPKWDTIRDPQSYLNASVAHGARNIYRTRTRDGSRLVAPAEVVHDSNRELQDSLLRLPFRQRAAVVLRYYTGLDDPAIAKALGCTRSTVRSSVRRGLQQLRKEVEQ